MQKHRTVCCSGLVYVSVDEIESGIVVIVTYTYTYMHSTVHVLAAVRRCEHVTSVTSLTFSYSSNNPAATLHILLFTMCCLCCCLFVLCLVRSVFRTTFPQKVKTRRINLPAGIFTSIRTFLWNCFVGCRFQPKTHMQRRTKWIVVFSMLHTRTPSNAHIFAHGGFIKWNCFCYTVFFASHKNSLPLERMRVIVWVHEWMKEWMGLVNINNTNVREHKFLSRTLMWHCAESQ